MTAIEQALSTALTANPENWELRLELLSKLSASGSHDDFLRLLAEAPNPPASEKELRLVTDLCVKAKQPAAAEPVLSAFVSENPASGLGHYLFAKLLAKTGGLDKARGHYATAIALNSDLEDDILASKLADFGQTMMHSPAEADAVIQELSEPAPAAEVPVVTAIEPVPEPEPEPAVAASAVVTIPVSVAPIAPPESLAMAPPIEEFEPDVPAEVEEATALNQIPALEADVAPPPLVPEIPEHADPANLDFSAPVDPHAHIVGDGDAEMVEFEAGAHLTRRIILGDPAELIEAPEKEKATGRGITAIAIAVLAHMLIAILLAWMVMASAPEKPPTIVATAMGVLDDPSLEVREVQKQVQRTPVQSASALADVISVSGMSEVALPKVDTPAMTFEPIGMGDAFGSSMTFDAGADGGMVSFFGSKSTSKKVVFAVDYSASMRSMDKDKLMRAELSKSLTALPNGISYQCIFFAGPSWYHGQTLARSGSPNVVKAEKGNDKWPWVAEKGAIYKPGFTDDPRELPMMDYISSSRSNIRKSVKLVQETPLVYGTDWRWPLYMAMNLKADTIYFMTDGAYSGGQKVLDELIAYNNKNGRARINTICMMVPQAMEKLQFLAEKSRGECSLVLKDETVLRGKDLEAYLKKGKKK
ncbi:MAG: tetratricopeptide (TPR) repeat protein [Verrucomicrobiales bacterium]|jgi:tetratricopeptide (TPR) repeat protein